MCRDRLSGETAQHPRPLGPGLDPQPQRTLKVVRPRLENRHASRSSTSIDHNVTAARQPGASVTLEQNVCNYLLLRDKFDLGQRFSPRLGDPRGRRRTCYTASGKGSEPEDVEPTERDAPTPPR